jgi:hypothetical protein
MYPVCNHLLICMPNACIQTHAYLMSFIHTHVVVLTYRAQLFYTLQYFHIHIVLAYTFSISMHMWYLYTYVVLQNIGRFFMFTTCYLSAYIALAYIWSTCSRRSTYIYTYYLHTGSTYMHILYFLLLHGSQSTSLCWEVHTLPTAFYLLHRTLNIGVCRICWSLLAFFSDWEQI